MSDRSWKCTACGESNPPYTEVCRSCQSVAPSQNLGEPSDQVATPKKLILAVLLATPYLFVLPPVLLFAIIFLVPCAGTRCKIFETYLATQSSSTLLAIAAVMIVLFFASWAGRAAKNEFLRFTARVHFFACLLAPGGIGAEGFGWPAPFFVSVLVNFASSSPHTIRPTLELFFITWLGVFGILLFIGVIHRFYPRRTNAN